MAKTPRTQTPPHTIPLHIHGGDMSSPFKILGEFWEIDEHGDPATDVQYGILEWEPSRKVERLILFSSEEESATKLLADRVKNFGPACLHGVGLMNIATGKPHSARYSINAFRRGGTFSAAVSAGYSHVLRHYPVRHIWEGDTSINLHGARYTQIGFSFKGLEPWLRHTPDIIPGFGTKEHRISEFETDILRDIRIPNVGRLRLLCGHSSYGDFLFERTVRLEHQWQIDFSRPKTFDQCLKILQAVWDCVDIAVGAAMPLKYIVLTRGDINAERPERFSVRADYPVSADEERKASEILGMSREYISFPNISDAFWKKWMKAALDDRDKSFSDYVRSLIEGYKITDASHQYELLALIKLVESIAKRMSPGGSQWGFPKKLLRTIVEQHTPQIFPERILDRKMEGGEKLLDWIVTTRNTQIAHIGEAGAVEAYSIPEGIYAESVLRLLAMSLLAMEYKLLRHSDIRKFFWEGYRSKTDLSLTPDKFIHTSIFPDGI